MNTKQMIEDLEKKLTWASIILIVFITLEVLALGSLVIYYGVN